jgi:hypothetical protein
MNRLDKFYFQKLNKISTKNIISGENFMDELKSKFWFFYFYIKSVSSFNHIKKSSLKERISNYEFE